VDNVLEKLAEWTGYMERTTKCSIIGGDLNLPYVDWNGHAEKSTRTHVFLNRLVWENGYTQLVNSPTGGNVLFDVYLVQPESAFTSCSNVHGISDHCRVLLGVERGENCHKHQVERLVPVHYKTNVTGLQIFLRHKLASWASNGSCMEETWEHFTEIVFESIDLFVPHKILRKNPDPEYYNKEVKRHKEKGRREHDKRKLGQQKQGELKRLSKELLAAEKKLHRRHFCNQYYETKETAGLSSIST
jgi:hypothetical protein